MFCIGFVVGFACGAFTVVLWLGGRKPELVAEDGACCAIGSVCKSRGVSVEKVDPECPDSVGHLVGISRSMAAEIEFINDEDGPYDKSETPAERWTRVRLWVDRNITPRNIAEVRKWVVRSGIGHIVRRSSHWWARTYCGLYGQFGDFESEQPPRVCKACRTKLRAENG